MKYVYKSPLEAAEAAKAFLARFPDTLQEYRIMPVGKVSHRGNPDGYTFEVR